MPRTSNLNRTQRDSKSIRLLAHRGEAAFVGIGAATQYDRVARLAMEYGIGLSAARQEQYHDEQKTSRHNAFTLTSRCDDQECAPCHALDRGGSARGTCFLTSRPKRTWSSPGI